MITNGSRNFEIGVGGRRAESNVSTPSHHIANAHNEPYAFYFDLLKILMPIGQKPPPSPLNPPLAKAYNTCIATQVAYRSCRGAVHVTDLAGVGPIGRRLSERPQDDL